MMHHHAMGKNRVKLNLANTCTGDLDLGGRWLNVVSDTPSCYR